MQQARKKTNFPLKTKKETTTAFNRRLQRKRNSPPNARLPAKFAYKLEYYKPLSTFFRSRFNADDRVVWVGDLNTAPEPIDVYDPERLYGSVCFHPAEHLALREIMSFGFHDVYRRQQPEEKEFTFWDYRIPNAAKRGLG